MKCPHCLENCYVEKRTFWNFNLNAPGQRYIQELGKDPDGYWWIEKVWCPNSVCGRVILSIINCQNAQFDPKYPQSRHPIPAGDEYIIHVRPKATNRQPVPVEIPNDFAEDYREACLVLADSPKASAALSRRCLQHILREKAGVRTPNNLAEAIQEIVDDHAVPSDVSEILDMVRNIGNFSAHPNKSLKTGEIVDVEPMEAEWCLDAIEVLFDFYFVRPADIRRRKLVVNEKLAETGKPQMPLTD